MKKFSLILIATALFALSCATDSFGVYHTVKKGENVTKISQLYNVDANELRQDNSIPEGVDELKEGSAIFIPGADEVIETSPEPEPETSPEPTPEPAPAPVQTFPETSPETSPETAPEPEPEAEEPSIDFIWPAAGKIVRLFSASAPKIDGIDLEFEKSTEIHAAAEGKVIYSASNANFGNMVIIRHNADFITVYSYLHTIFAKEGQNVKQNDVLGIADATEMKSVPTLHFEVRKGAKPVDPVKYLPQN